MRRAVSPPRATAEAHLPILGSNTGWHNRGYGTRTLLSRRQSDDNRHSLRRFFRALGRCVRSQLAWWAERRDRRYRRSFASSPWPIDRQHRRNFDGGRIGSATGSSAETIRRASTPMASGFFPWTRIGQYGPDQSVSKIGVSTPIYGILILGMFFDTRRT